MVDISLRMDVDLFDLFNSTDGDFYYRLATTLMKAFAKRRGKKKGVADIVHVTPRPTNENDGHQRGWQHRHSYWRGK